MQDSVCVDLLGGYANVKLIIHCYKEANICIYHLVLFINIGHVKVSIIFGNS